MQNSILIALVIFASALWGCENTDLQLVAGAGVDAVKAVTLTDAAVAQLSRQSSQYMDSQHTVAPAGSKYAKRLTALVVDDIAPPGYTFNYQVYMVDQVNAFALADGTIRIYSGLMDMLDDGELKFVIGHEMGHVVKQHTRNKLRLAYAASAVRKGIAANNSMAGDLARSQLGGLVELLMGAQFSQLEEKVADDYGLSYLQMTKDYSPDKAVSALRKLATLGKGHSFLSSHPDPEARAERITLQLQGKAVSLEKAQQGFIEMSKEKLAQWLAALLKGLSGSS